MFRRLLLIESFEFVASPDEWQTFQSFGEVSDVDRWIQALAESPGRDCASGKLDHYERLRSMFLTRVQERLRSGEWICEAFDPTHGPELRLIPEQLWRLLEFAPFNDEVSGGGFKFVGLQFSAPRSKSAGVVRSTPGTTRRRLTDWLRKIAEGGREPVRRADLLDEAKAALANNSITQNLLNECLRNSGLSDALLFKGRPPT